MTRDEWMASRDRVRAALQTHRFPDDTPWRKTPPLLDELTAHAAAHPPGWWWVQDDWKGRPHDFRDGMLGDGVPVSRFPGNQHNKRCAPVDSDGRVAPAIP